LVAVATDNGKLKPLHFQESDVLWITGGTRGLGLMCAFHFVKKYDVRKLVLLGQEQIPSRDQWDKFLENDSPTARKIRNIKSLESLGAEVKVLSTPLTDKDTVFKAVQEIKRWGTIRGVVHCAGTGDNNNPAFIKKSLHEIQKVMDPKITGLNNLYDCVRTEPLSFFLLFSSVSGVIPTLGVGQSAYAMSNSYMDHFAEAKSKECPIISIQWPSWRETGMGEAKTKAYDQTGLKSLSDAEGLSLLDRVLEQQLSPVVLPCIVSHDGWQPQKLLKHDPLAKKSNEAPSDAIPARVGPSDDAEKLTIKVLGWLKDLLCKELKLEPSDLKVDKPFQDYGIDSIMIAQLLQPIRKKILQDIDPSILYEYTSITAFTGWLVKNHQPVLSKIFLAEEPGKIEGIPEKEHVSAGSHNSPIAVVGMACRFPGASDLNGYWDLLLSGNSAIQPVPGERWENAGNDFAGLIDDPFSFDPKFFLLHEEDVKAMDPQALVALEETMKLFHHAGYTQDEIKGKMIGVYIGGRSGHSVDADTLSAVRNPVMVVGQNYLSANISQFFDLRGPSMTIDTACSSALVGMNAAIRALQNGEIECAVVGGVNILSSDKTHELFRQRGILKEGEDFHLFDQRAKGIIPGEGAGMVLLKTLEQARIDGDFIYATIRSVAINNDGRTAGPATPNIEAQRQVMQSALSAAGKDPEDIQYIEVNGSGSLVTDLIELKTISSVYGSSDRAACGLGSIKPNIGHPLCAEGIASFIKVVLMLHHKRFVPFLSGQQPPPYVDLASSRFEFCRTADQWAQAERTAAINCFADGGTNAHVILESYDPPEQVHIARRPIEPPSLNRKNFRSQKEITTVESLVLERSTTFQSSLPDSFWERFN
jgi:polyketide synthase PksL